MHNCELEIEVIGLAARTISFRHRVVAAINGACDTLMNSA